MRSAMVIDAGSAPAAEARGVVDTAGALVLRDLWIRTQRPRAHGLSVLHSRTDDRCGSGALLHPADERCERIEGADADATAAMKHARHHEHPVEVSRLRPQLRDDAFVVIDAHHRVQRVVGPAVVADDLAAARAEPGE